MVRPRAVVPPRSTRRIGRRNSLLSLPWYLRLYQPVGSEAADMDRTTTAIVLVFMTVTMAFGIKTTQLAGKIVATVQAENSVIQQELQGIARP